MTALSKRDWRLIAEDIHGGAMNMALDEIAAETAAAGGPRTLRVYRWTPSTLSLGYHQNPETVDWAYCEREGIDVVRRQTGGGGIYHDTRGDISYSIVAPAAELPGDLMETYELLCEPLFDALCALAVPSGFAGKHRDAIYEPACYLRGFHPAHDVLADGKKISGNAQYRRRDAIVQHGSLTYAVDAATHLAVFADHDISPARFRERVTGVEAFGDIDRSAAVDALARAFGEWAQADRGTWTKSELTRARTRAKNKYATDDWNRGSASGRATR
jgi:lipoate---protein ligase